MQARAKTCKAEVGVLRKALKEASYSVPRADGGAIGGSSDGDEAVDGSAERARLLRIGEQMTDGNSKLQQAHRTVLETESIGISILGDLRSQRETLQHATGTLQRANEGLLRSKRMLTAISRRALANKMVMWLLIVLLGCGILLLLYVELFGFGGSRHAAGSAAGGAKHHRNATKHTRS
jgi:vesicle transport through interaction with t-SNAREs protein 1